MKRLAATLLIGLLIALFVIAAPTTAQTAGVVPLEPAPSATQGPASSLSIIDTGDPRSNGQGPGLVGSPFVILLGVIGLGLVTAGGTILYLRVANRR